MQFLFEVSNELSIQIDATAPSQPSITTTTSITNIGIVTIDGFAEAGITNGNAGSTRVGYGPALGLVVECGASMVDRILLVCSTCKILSMFKGLS